MKTIKSATKTGLLQILLIGFLFFLSINTAFASQWAKIYGDTGASESIQQTSDGGYIVAGGTSYDEINPLFEFKVIKLDKGGNIVWQKVYDAGKNSAKSVQEDSSGGYIVSGESCFMGDDYWILKLDRNGEVSWGKSLPTFSTVQPVSNGGYILTGRTAAADTTGLLAMKLDADGNVVWQKAYGGGYGNSVRQTSDGGFIFIGTISSYGSGGNDLWLIKLDGNGTAQWQKAYGGTGDDRGVSVEQTRDGGYVAAGSSNSFNGGRSGIWVLKLDSEGNIQWQKTFYDLDDPYSLASSVQQTTEGGFILSGSRVVIKLSENGDVEWERTYWNRNFPNESCISSVQQTLGGGYILAEGNCFSSCSSVGSGFFILKLDQNGEIPDCPFVEPAFVEEIPTDVTGLDTSVVGLDSNIIPKAGDVTPTNLNLNEHTLCSYPFNPNILIDPQEVHFGAVLPNEAAKKVITITNASDETVSVEKATAPSNPVFSVTQDNCSAKILAPGANCSVSVDFSPPAPAGSGGGYFEGIINIILNDSYESTFTAYLSGGISLTLSAPSNGVTFDACSLITPPTFSWDVAEDFERYEINYLSGDSYYSGGRPLMVRVSGKVPGVSLQANVWKKVMSLPGSSGGIIYWGVVGKQKAAVAGSESRHFYIASPNPVGNPIISSTSKSPPPGLSWQNNCNTKFKAWFGSDPNFTRKTILTFNDRTPNDNGGEFSKTLTQNQWMTVRRLVGDKTGSTIYWYVESWDGLGRYAITDVMSFTLTD